jgi:hypothetical protein
MPATRLKTKQPLYCCNDCLSTVSLIKLTKLNDH